MAFSIIQTADSGLLIGGSYQLDGFGSGQILLFKTNQSGEPVWTRTYGERLIVPPQIGEVLQIFPDEGTGIIGYSNRLP